MPALSVSVGELYSFELTPGRLIVDSEMDIENTIL